MSDFGRQLLDYRLTTAEILYHMPDYPDLLQSYIWQDLDLSPSYPVLRHFLEFWDTHLDGKRHSVRVASLELIRPAEFKVAEGLYYLH